MMPYSPLSSGSTAMKKVPKSRSGSKCTKNAQHAPLFLECQFYCVIETNTVKYLLAHILAASTHILVYPSMHPSIRFF